MMVLAQLLLGAQIGAQAMLVADRAPQLNVQPSCAAAARSGVNGRTEQICMNEETAAKSALDGRWSQFAGGDRARCTGLVNTGGPPSYVELLTCLDMAEQARKIPDDGLKPSTSGMGSPER